MLLYMLDTDTVSLLVRGRDPALDARIAATPPRQLCISAVTRGELLFGLNLKPGAHRLAALIDELLQRLPCQPWDATAATRYASIAAVLHRAGTPIGGMDTMIAGHASALGAVLVTNNVRHFAQVPELQFQNWVAEPAR
jgi:tRNA(fMet)-specific endonuclease VapC